MFLGDCGLPDEAFLPREAPQDLKGHRFALAEDSVERKHAVGRDEDPSVLEVKEHSQIGEEVNRAFDRNPVVEVLGHLGVFSR